MRFLPFSRRKDSEIANLMKELDEAKGKSLQYEAEIKVLEDQKVVILAERNAADAATAKQMLVEFEMYFVL